MGYRELSRMEAIEVVRRWQMGESQRAIARGSGVARETVKKYLGAAEELGLAANGPPPTEEQVVRLEIRDEVAEADRELSTAVDILSTHEHRAHLIPILAARAGVRAMQQRLEEAEADCAAVLE